jgi:hypothetical protein
VGHDARQLAARFREYRRKHPFHSDVAYADEKPGEHRIIVLGSKLSSYCCFRQNIATQAEAIFGINCQPNGLQNLFGADVLVNINVSTTGNYSFSTTSDDGSL